MGEQTPKRDEPKYSVGTAWNSRGAIGAKDGRARERRWCQ